VILAALSVAAGFGLIWHMWWLAAGGLVAVVARAVAPSLNLDRDFPIPGDEVARTAGARPQTLEKGAAGGPVEHRIANPPRRRRRAPAVPPRRGAPSGEQHPPRVLDLPDERLPHLRGPVRHLWRARPQLRRRTDGRRALRTADGGGEHGHA